ncbi:MAG: hypothetical protein ABEJ93_05025 [Candidatus Nanohalobium sp.]
MFDYEGVSEALLLIDTESRFVREEFRIKLEGAGYDRPDVDELLDAMESGESTRVEESYRKMVEDDLKDNRVVELGNCFQAYAWVGTMKLAEMFDQLEDSYDDI